MLARDEPRYVQPGDQEAMDLRSIPDDELAHRAAKGDDEAFAELLRRHLNLVIAVLRAYGPSDGPEFWGEMAQRTFIEAYKSLPSYRGGKFVSFLGTIARRVRLKEIVSVERYRNALKRAHEEYLSVYREARRDSSRDDDLSTIVRRCLEKLSSKYRQAILLKGRGHSVGEIANVLGIGKSAAQSRCYRGKIAFQECLQEKGVRR